ncbi:NACHT domain-containing protein [Streptomyces coryli]|uniref:NACHT domain-containing protein n=1 Tax=Streptomyces coryli TaxID=1128680 RepID=UPI0030B8C302
MKDGPGAEVAVPGQPVRLSGLVSFKGEKRALGDRELRKLAQKLVEQALRSGERPVPPDEETAVADALAASLRGLGDLTLTDVEAVELGPEKLAHQLRATGGHPERHLSADAAHLHDRLLDLACLHILHFFTQRSTFVATTLVAQTRRQAELIAKTDELIARTPRPDAQDAAFERDYLGYVTRRHGKLTIYGVDLAHSPAKWPLDAAYMRLEATAPAPAAQRSAQDESFPEQFEPSGPVIVPADQVLAQHDRVLLRGAAGSGKTTLVQWLAVSTARAPGEHMAYLRGLVPFVLPLRTLTRKDERLPAPTDFLAKTDCPLAGSQPRSWEYRVLTAGRGLLLVDGIDEVPKGERPRVQRWLTDLIDAYPGNRWLVTSRPSAVDEDWLAAEGFTELTLAPMGATAVADFIHRWHTAVRTGGDEDARLPVYENQLRAAVRAKPDLGRLATNPLMCGLMCALNRDRRGYLPRGRKELYEAALSMLLARRDRERDMTGPDPREEPQLQVLQRLAYWLIRNGRTEMTRDRALLIIHGALPSVPELAALGEDSAVLEHFRDRSGLLREPGPDAVDFVHRTFQDYLGARAAVQEGDIGLLATHASDDQWEDVIRMAVAQARPRERDQILRELLREADWHAERPGETAAVLAMRVRLLAMACLEHSAELDPMVREAVEQQVERLIPPSTLEEARSLAAAGPIVLDLLPAPEEAEAGTAHPVIVAASHVESDRAIGFLSQYAKHPSLNVRRQLVWAWHRFDSEDYAAEVISRLDPLQLYFTVTSDAELRVLKALGTRSMLETRGTIDLTELQSYVATARLTNLVMQDHQHLEDPAFLADESTLTYVRFSNCPRLRDLTGIAELPLTGLVLDEVPRLADLPGLLATLGQLRLLSLSPSRDVPLELGQLPPMPELVSLNLMTATVADLRALRRFLGLSSLFLGWRSSPGDRADWAVLGELPELRKLRLTPNALIDAPEGVALPNVNDLTIVDRDQLGTQGLSRLAGLFPGMTRLTLDAPSYSSDFRRDSLPSGIEVVVR